MLRDFSCDDLDQALDFAERVFDLPQVGKVEVWEDMGGYRYRDTYEAAKDWYGSALAALPYKPPSFRQRLFWLIERWFGYEFAMRLPYP